MDYRLLNVAVALLTAMNIAMTIYLTNYLIIRVPFDMDLIRAEFSTELKDMMRYACMHGVEFREQTEPIPWGGPYPIDYCNQFIADKAEYIYEKSGQIGLKSRYSR